MTPPTPRGMGDYDPPEDLPERADEAEDFGEPYSDAPLDWPEPPDPWHGVDPKEKP